MYEVEASRSKHYYIRRAVLSRIHIGTKSVLTAIILPSCQVYIRATEVGISCVSLFRVRNHVKAFIRRDEGVLNARS